MIPVPKRFTWIQVGALADYHSVIGGPVTQPGLEVRAAPFLTPAREWCAMLKGKAGWVACEALTPAAASAARPPPEVQAAVETIAAWARSSAATLRLVTQGVVRGVCAAGADSIFRGATAEDEALRTRMEALATEAERRRKEMRELHEKTRGGDAIAQVTARLAREEEKIHRDYADALREALAARTMNAEASAVNATPSPVNAEAPVVNTSRSTTCADCRHASPYGTSRIECSAGHGYGIDRAWSCNDWSARTAAPTERLQ